MVVMDAVGKVFVWDLVRDSGAPISSDTKGMPRLFDISYVSTSYILPPLHFFYSRNGNSGLYYAVDTKVNGLEVHVFKEEFVKSPPDELEKVRGILGLDAGDQY